MGRVPNARAHVYLLVQGNHTFVCIKEVVILVQATGTIVDTQEFGGFKKQNL